MNEPEKLILKTADHPEANGREAQNGDVQWCFWMTLEDGRRLELLMGREGRENLRNCILQEDADDLAETKPSNYQNFAFPSTGDPAKDREIADRHIQSDRLIAEDMCPNGCGPLAQVSSSERECPKCKFTHHKVAIYAG
jgi:hypothetical protein